MKRKTQTVSPNLSGASTAPQPRPRAKVISPRVFQLFFLEGVSRQNISPFLTTEDQLRFLCINTDTLEFYPPHVQHLEGISFSKIHIFTHLQHLRLSPNFNDSVTLPPRLLSLNTGARFNQSLDLPSTLQSLTFGGPYSKQIVRFPPNLRYLRVGKSYQHPILLPDQLEEFVLTGFRYEHALMIPASLLRFTSWACHSNNTLKFHGNSRLNYLQVRTLYGTFEFPRSLVSLKIHFYQGSVLQLPEGLQEFHQMWCRETMKIDRFPPNLRILHYWSFFPVSKVLPNTLEELHLFNVVEGIRIPDSVKHLSISQLNRAIHFPASLEYLLVRESSLPLALPSSVRTLVVGCTFRQMVTLPPKLRSLKRETNDHKKLITIPKREWSDLGETFVRNR